MSNDESNVDGELLSPVSATSQQSQWPRPQTPIDPRKLAKLANALGISTPVPMSTSTDSTKQLSSRSTSSFGRSPTPSAASTSNLSAHSTSSAFQSKFLLHVIPPPNLPHDTNTADVMLTPPPTSASGYHTQFRRGTLVPFLPTFHAQLGAIAKEYALPSTTGMILYLVTSSSTPNSSPSPSPVPSLHGRRSSLDISEEPGPRLSEDIWRHLWSRVVKTELGGYPSRAGTPVGLGLNANASPGTTPTLRPLVSSNGKAPLAPSGSSSISSSVNGASETSQSEATTPDTSLPPDSNPDALDLPGLHSPSLIPILAKVEFDIDRRKATWYGPWVRSRKHNHQKRIAQRGPDDDSRLHLKVIDRQKKPRFLSSKDVADDLSDEPEYAPRAGSPEEDEDEDATAQLEDNISSTKRVPPRLVLPPTDSNIIPADDEANPIGRRPKLAYRESDTEDEGGDTRRPPESKRSPLEEKRGGAFFDDLLLGLRFTDSADYDEDDPYDRRRSQYIMQQRLDEIERNLHQFSPRKLKYEDDAHSLTSTPPRSSKSAQFLSPSDRSLPLPGGSSNSQSESNPEQPKWPAVPYSQLTGGNDEDTSPDISLDAGDFPSPPKFALNGVSNAIPLSPYKKSVSEDSGESEESKARRREHVEGHEPSYPSVMPPSLRSGKRPDSAGEVIPLSPDPFGRFPVETVPPVPAMPSRMSESSHRSSSSQSRTAFSFDGAPEGGATLDRDDSMSSVSDKHTSTKLSSRFSLDSDDHNALQASSRSGAQPGGASLNPVKSIRTLWRKSRKSSVSGERPAPMGPVPRVPSINGGQVHAQAQTQTQSQPARPPSQQQSLGVPMPRVSEEVVTNAMLPPGYPRRGPAHPDVAVAITTGPSLTTAEMIRRARGEQSINAIHFDQESPYPIRRAPTPNSPSTSPVPARPQPSPTPSSGEPEDSKGSTRKSILKSWRGNGSAEDDSVSAAPRKRRPSVMDLVRNSRLSAAGEAVPPSPMLPEQYANGQSQAGQRTTRSSKGSSYSSRSSGQLLHTPMGPPAVQDETFEIVDESSHAKSPSLSYPYHELDHQA